MYTFVCCVVGGIKGWVFIGLILLYGKCFIRYVIVCCDRGVFVFIGLYGERCVK